MARGLTWLELSTIVSVGAALALSVGPRLHHRSCEAAQDEARVNLLALRTQEAAFQRAHHRYGEVWAGCFSKDGCAAASVCTECAVDFRPMGTKYHYWTSWTSEDGYVAHAASLQLDRRDVWTLAVTRGADVVGASGEPEHTEDGCR